MGEMRWGYNAVGWFWMLPVLMLFWGVVIAAIVLLVRALGAPRIDGDEAMKTLRKRLAAGEISPDDYERTKRLLQS
jgi:putative membrane protein